jgi:hypothetical protein
MDTPIMKASDETLLAELIRLEHELSGVTAVLDQIEEGLCRAVHAVRQFEGPGASPEAE